MRRHVPNSNEFILGPGSHYTKIVIGRRPHRFRQFNVQKYYAALLVHLLRKRWIEFSSKVSSPICGATDIYVEYIYEYDIHNQAFNSSFQDLNSAVVQHLQSIIADQTSAELYKRNLLSSIPDQVRIRKIRDVSKEYQNHPTIRLYISVNLLKNFIPTIHHIFQLIFEKLQQENFSTSTDKNFSTNLLLIPSRS